MIALEVCVDTLEGLQAAAAAGASRIELCSALDLGGLTPSCGLMQVASALAVPVHAMIRPRAGSFRFDAGEIALMIADVKVARATGLQGVVLGALRADAHGHRGLDHEALASIAVHCGGLSLTLHRAFDLVTDPVETAERAIGLGFQRILTSGGERTALQGAARIAELDARFRGRISIMPGAGIDAGNLAAIVDGTTIAEVHASCRSRRAMADDRGITLGFGSDALHTDPVLIAALLSACRRVVPVRPEVNSRE